MFRRACLRTSHYHASLRSQQGSLRMSGMRQLFTKSSITRQIPSIATRRAAGLMAGLVGAMALPAYLVSAQEKEDLATEEEEAAAAEDEEDWENEPNTSAPRDMHPTKPGLTVIVGDSVDEILFSGKTDVMVKCFTQWCHACKKLTPIYDQVALVLKDEPSIRIAEMDVGENFNKRVFASKDEAFGTPLLKLFTKDGKTHVWETPPITAEEMLKWMHQHVTDKFDLAAALERCQPLNKEVDAKVRKEVERQLDEHLSKDESFSHFTVGPCSQEWREWILFFSASNFIPGSREQRAAMFSDLREQYQQCIATPRYKSFWESLSKHATEQVATAERLLEMRAEEAKEEKEKKGEGQQEEKQESAEGGKKTE